MHPNELITAQEISLIVGVADMKISKAFYSSLGFSVDKDYSKFVSFDGGNSVGLALYQWDSLAADAGVSPPGTGFRGFTLTRRADSRHAVDSLMTHAEKGGAHVISAGTEIESGGYRGYLADPDGFLWTVTADRDAHTV